ncbi:MAG: Asp-tRNA(Asn)/Glu-tRNA(Gln) amidotransferase subunit GatB [Thermoanaerobaculia bacterium]
MLAWEPVIGLEVHVQLATRSKLFCRCENRFGAPPNTLICPVCLGYPGALPVANGYAVELAATLALALDCEVHGRSEFARKNYFYPDLPKGYQISQFDRPLATGGTLPLQTGDRTIRIHRLHLEEDAGKLLHEAPGGGALRDSALVDFNRCGVPLVEIVTEPDLRSAAEAEAVLRTLHRLLLYTRTSDANMEEGSLRCDANVSLRRAGTTPLGVKVEIKNLNSFRHVARAIEYEIERQRDLLESAAPVVAETRGYDDGNGTTYSQRGKEEAHDYRYFPDPDLPAIVLSAERIAGLRARLPESPWRRQQRLQASLGLAEEEAGALVSARELADYFERIVAAGAGLAPRTIANWVRNETLRELNERQAGVDQAPAPEQIAGLLRLIEDGTLSLVGAREVHTAIWGTDENPAEAARRLGRIQIRDDAALAAWVDEVIAEFPSQVAELRAGKIQVLGFLTGQIMRRSAGRADARRSQELLRERLDEGGEADA